MRTDALRKLLNEMSLEEKVGQMVQMSKHLVMDGGVMTGPVDSMEVSAEERKLIGSILGKIKTEETKKVQDEYMENHPHHIPLLFMGDVINGMETIFPIPLGQGCTFHPELVEACARIAAREAAVSGLHVTFSPMVTDSKFEHSAKAYSPINVTPLPRSTLSSAVHQWKAL